MYKRACQLHQRFSPLRTVEVKISAFKLLWQVLFSPRPTMKFFLCLSVAVLTLGITAAEDKKDTADSERPRTFRRLIPADVLRDFPGVCFASTRCATVEPGHTWELSPFCGRSTCVKPEGEEPGHLLELVEDCGPLPKPNPKCKLSDKTNKTATFPDCCPIFECEDGVTLEYPEIPTVVPPSEDKKDAKA